MEKYTMGIMGWFWIGFAGGVLVGAVVVLVGLGCCVMAAWADDRMGGE